MLKSLLLSLILATPNSPSLTDVNGRWWEADLLPARIKNGTVGILKAVGFYAVTRDSGFPTLLITTTDCAFRSLISTSRSLDEVVYVDIQGTSLRLRVHLNPKTRTGVGRVVGSGQLAQVVSIGGC